MLCLIKYELDLNGFVSLNYLFLFVVFAFLAYKKQLQKKNTEKLFYLPHFLLEQCFKGTVVNRTLPSWRWSFKITLTVPLKYIFLLQ